MHVCLCFHTLDYADPILNTNCGQTSKNIDEGKDRINVYVLDNDKKGHKFEEDKFHLAGFGIDNGLFFLAFNLDKHFFVVVFDVEINPFQSYFNTKKNHFHQEWNSKEEDETSFGINYNNHCVLSKLADIFRKRTEISSLYNCFLKEEINEESKYNGEPGIKGTKNQKI